MSVLMNEGKFVRVFPTRDAAPDRSIGIVDGAGRYAVPGYNNMHSHALIAERPELLLASMLAEGVTGFRQMLETAKLLQARDEGRLPLGADASTLVHDGKILIREQLDSAVRTLRLNN